MDSRWAKKGPLSVVLEIGCVGSLGKGDFEDDVRRWIECGGESDGGCGCVLCGCVVAEAEALGFDCYDVGAAYYKRW